MYASWNSATSTWNKQSARGVLETGVLKTSQNSQVKTRISYPEVFFSKRSVKDIFDKVAGWKTIY